MLDDMMMVVQPYRYSIDQSLSVAVSDRTVTCAVIQRVDPLNDDWMIVVAVKCDDLLVSIVGYYCG